LRRKNIYSKHHQVFKSLGRKILLNFQLDVEIFLKTDLDVLRFEDDGRKIKNYVIGL
jgi:hypothetical protein